MTAPSKTTGPRPAGSPAEDDADALAKTYLDIWQDQWARALTDPAMAMATADVMKAFGSGFSGPVRRDEADRAPTAAAPSDDPDPDVDGSPDRPGAGPGTSSGDDRPDQRRNGLLGDTGSDDGSSGT